MSAPVPAMGIITFQDILAEQPYNKGLEGPPTFCDGEKVFAFHQNMLYEAKVLKVEKRNKINSTRLGEQELYYFIHYQGWKPKWDEWVNDSRILKFTNQNKTFERNMREASKKKTNRKLRENSPSKKVANRPLEGSDEIIDVSESLELPYYLQKALANDYDLVVNQKKIVSLPCQYTVSDILIGFADEKLKQNESGAFHTSILSDIQTYFNQSIGTLLLYRVERPQYAEIIASKTRVDFSQIYGPQHLLRLCYSLPNTVAASALSPDARNLILFYISEISNYMEKNGHELFSSKAYMQITNPQAISLEQ